MPVWSSTTGACEVAGRVHDLDLRLDEQGHPDALASQLLDGRPQMGMAADDVEPAFGGALLALFRHEAGRMRPQLRGEADHLGGRRHLEIERHEELPLEALHVLVPDMAPVLAQMGRDPVGPRQDRQMRGPDRVRMDAAAGVPHGCDVIDVDAEA